MIIPNTKNQYIDFDRKEIYLINNGVKTIMNSDKNGLYKLTLSNGLIIYKNIDWITHLTKEKLVFMDEYLYALNNLIFKKQKPFGVSREYEWLPLFKSPIVIDNKYRLIAKYPKYAVSWDGVVINIITKSKIKPEDVYVFGYKRVRLKATIDVRYRIPSVHRLVAMCWVPNDDYINKNVIDHKDNNKLNNDYKNLRWVSSSFNISKTRNRYHGFKVINLDTLKETTHSTILDVSNFIGKNSKIDLSRQPLNPYRIWKTRDGIFKVLHNTKSKIYDNTPNTNKLIKQIKNIHTKEIIDVKSSSEIIKITGLAKSTIIKYLDLKIESKAIGDWLIRYKSNKPWADDLGTMYVYSKPNKKVIVVNIKGEKIIEFDSINQTAKIMQLSCRTIQKKINKTKSIKFNNELVYLISPL